ncbi:MAG TPA: M20/M25/M40 family metallo-hydrolase [Acidimicrobiales bacterium]|nr:M20/M25/M40 family metallo-hydrolase [Acidimicrobiales bacterium]
MSDASGGEFSLEPRVDVYGISLEVGPMIRDVSVGRMQAAIERLAVSPRDVVEDHAAALAAADFVDSELQTIGLATRRVDAEAQGVVLPSVWSEIPGTESDATFVFLAHYDTVPGSPGADDNASGVAGMLEIARILKENPLPVRTVVATAGFEEMGNFAGSAAVAQALHGETEMIGMISLEMIGFTTDEPSTFLPIPADFLAIVGDDKSEAFIHTFHSAAARWLPQRRVIPIAMDPEVNTNVRRSDHAAFWALGVPAAMATDTANFRNPHYHQPTDTPDKIDYDFARDCTSALMIGGAAYSRLWVDGGVPPLS